MKYIESLGLHIPCGCIPRFLRQISIPATHAGGLDSAPVLLLLDSLLPSLPSDFGDENTPSMPRNLLQLILTSFAL